MLINCSCNPHKSPLGNHLDVVSKSLDLHFSTYDKIILFGDFIAKINEQHVKLLLPKKSSKTTDMV